MTSDPTPLVATCGGNMGDRGITSSCLVLDPINQRWDKSRMGSLSMPRMYGAVAVLKYIGVFYLGGWWLENGTTSDFLATGSLQWTQGPTLPVPMSYQCIVPSPSHPQAS